VIRLRLTFAAFVIAACGVLPVIRELHAQETTIVMDDSGPAAGDCNCRSQQAPPWHGNVNGMSCPPMHHGNRIFQANPCGQLGMLCPWNRGCAQLPPCFPRLHGLCADGQMPTPRPIAIPRCHQCGAVIEGGF
jgi:hypothetical protein